MEIIKVGNWTITDEGIVWTGEPYVKYHILKERMNEPFDNTNIYDWLVHMVEKPWITRNDIYALNTAFIFALEYYGIGFTEDRSLVETLTVQNRRLKMEGK